MEPEVYLTELAKAYRDELVGYVIATNVASKFGETWPHRDMMLRLAVLEQSTADVLKPLMQKYDLPIPEQESVLLEGRRIAENTESWHAMAAFFKSALPDIITTFEQMYAACPAADRSRMGFLLRHEKALHDLAVEQSHQQPMSAIEDLIREASYLNESFLEDSRQIGG